MTKIYKIVDGDFVELTEAEWQASPQLTRRERGVKVVLTPEEAAEHLEREANPPEPPIRAKPKPIDSEGLAMENALLRGRIEALERQIVEIGGAADGVAEALSQRVEAVEAAVYKESEK